MEEINVKYLQSVRGLFPLITCFPPPSEQTKPNSELSNDDYTPIAIVNLFVKDLDKNKSAKVGSSLMGKETR